MLSFYPVLHEGGKRIHYMKRGSSSNILNFHFFSSDLRFLRYTRLTMTERYGGMTEAEGYALKWNKKLDATQKIRMSSAVDQESVDEDSLVAAVSEDDSSGGATDSND